MSTKVNSSPKKVTLKDPMLDSSQSIFNEKIFSKSNKKSKKIVREIVSNLLKVRDDSKIEITKSHIRFDIYGKKSHFKIEILKKIGFIINIDNLIVGSNEKTIRSLLLDKNLYKYSLKKSKKIFKKLNTSNINLAYKKIVTELELARNINLEKLLG